jgi:hypothetical protein
LTRRACCGASKNIDNLIKRDVSYDLALSAVCKPCSETKLAPISAFCAQPHLDISKVIIWACGDATAVDAIIIEVRIAGTDCTVGRTDAASNTTGITQGAIVIY